ncbi:universal stress protein [Ferrimicrobium acidiphilum]|uniref:universal stress protein n=1 Tax=Ferrimicrobium acidiphilum TaxID=121039 RepID=UPI0023F3A1F3|nr:universal stress protein [Ferrimicrobium acidiphilum]
MTAKRSDRQARMRRNSHPSNSPLVDQPDADATRESQDLPLRPSLNLLLPVGSDIASSTQLLWATANLANRVSVQVLVLHCREWDLAHGIKYFVESLEEANTITTNAMAWLSDLNIPSHGIVRDVERGSVGRGIASTALEYPVDSIMVGLHRKRRLFHGPLGSTISQIERSVTCPVVVINLDTNSSSTPR